MDNHSTRERIFNYIVIYKRSQDGLSPTLREICKACNISSTSVASHYIKLLEKTGRIKRLNASRGFAVIGGKWIYKT